MMVLEKSAIENESESQEEFPEEAPYGYKADGTPKKRPGRPKGSVGGSTGGGSKKYEKLKEPLAEKIVEYLGPPLAFTSPLAAGVLDDRADKTAAALCTLAATRPRIARIIDSLLSGGASIDLAITGMALVTAFAVEANRIEPNSAASHAFGVDRVYYELYTEEPAQNGSVAQQRGILHDLENENQ
jgi:hypothetical protein